MRTFLYESHLSLGAKVIDFAGWEMPLQYKGVLKEHQTVREQVGLFDVSHMGLLEVKGKDAEPFLDYLSTNRILEKVCGSATYTLWCDEQGGCVDDVMIFKVDREHFFVIVNAGNREKDLSHILHQAREFEVKIRPLYEGYGILALQGPLASALMTSILPNLETLKPMHFMKIKNDFGDCWISRTGYTGAGGYELWGQEEVIARWWKLLLDKGKEKQIEPIGLAARDTLRLEMGFALYGHELNETILGNETVSSWTIKWEKEKFLGLDALRASELSPNKRFEYGVIIQDKGIARQGCQVMKDSNIIGEVTSGSFSPTLKEAIAIIIVNKQLMVGDVVHVNIRQNQVKAKIIELPFVRKKQ